VPRQRGPDCEDWRVLALKPQLCRAVTGAPYREVNSKVATAPKLKVEDKDRVKIIHEELKRLNLISLS